MGTGPGQVSRNTVNLIPEDLEDDDPSEPGIQYDFLIDDITFYDPGGVVNQIVCMVIELEDAATDVIGIPEPNVRAYFDWRTVIQWI